MNNPKTDPRPFTEEEAKEVLQLLNDFESLMRRCAEFGKRFEDFAEPETRLAAIERVPEPYRDEILAKVAIIDALMSE